jgi:hypothetical protein
MNSDIRQMLQWDDHPFVQWLMSHYKGKFLVDSPDKSTYDPKREFFFKYQGVYYGPINIADVPPEILMAMHKTMTGKDWRPDVPSV